MDKVIERLRALSTKQKIIAAGGLAVGTIILTMMVRMASTEPMALLYSGLGEQHAGEVAAALDGEGVAYEVRGQSLFVPRGERDRIRLLLAQQNLPSPSHQGYELLDQLDGFSTTSEMFSVTYWRAKEGELARTLTSMPGISAARVHIGAEGQGAFSRQNRQRTASVTVTAPGGLDSAQLKAIRYLTALAVPGLPAADVAVIDSMRGLLTDDSAAAGLGDTGRAAHLEASLLSLLEARVGRGNARVNVAIDTVRRREESVERLVDPASAVITERTTEESTSSERGTDRALTVASDLPDGDDTQADRTANSSETREDVAYAVSTTDRKVETLPGGIARLSVAVLLNEVPGTDGESTPRSPEEIADLESLITAAAGVNESRGDSVIVKSMRFTPVQMAETPSVPLTERFLQPWLIRGAALVAGLIAFGIFILRPILKAGASAAVPGGDGAGLLTSEGIEGELMLIEDQNPVDRLRAKSTE